ncbi:MAG: VCBS repeat-containing protein, partial [Caldilineaceae bacterium]|nr:VCBS repeat-containing protein [Caldilineaceae bacterium]
MQLNTLFTKAVFQRSESITFLVLSARWLRVLLPCLLWICIPHALWAQDEVPLSLQESTVETDFTTSMAWGDYDNDGDLDLLVGNGMLITDDISENQTLINVIFAQFPDLRDFFVKGERNNVLYCNENGSLMPCWKSDENDFTTSVAWGDYDNDGDLDFAVGNAGLGFKWGFFKVDKGGANRVYRNNLNCPGRPPFEVVWSSPTAESTMSVAWGDYNKDNRLDLAFANSNHYMAISPSPTYDNGAAANQLYQNTTTTTDPCGAPTFTLDAAFSDLAEISFSVAWVDVDNDTDLDLAVANGRQVHDSTIVPDTTQGLERIFCNQLEEQGTATFRPCWQSTQPDFSIAMSWGDVDGNGLPDLAVGNGQIWQGEQNVLYANDGPDADGNLLLHPVWRSEESEPTVSVALGDADGDGDLDLAVGNGNFDGNAPNQIYCNTGRALAAQQCWESPEEDITLSIAWGDVDGDGALDLAVGNFSVPIGQQNRLYHNAATRFPLQFDAWTTPSANNAHAVAWGDMDGDGDLDLVLGIRGVNELYCNRAGALTKVTTFTPPADLTNAVAWGDMDGDHDLDLVVGNMAQPRDVENSVPYTSKLYRNDPPLGECQPQFTEVWSFGADEDTRALAWGDMDNDGDLDLAVGNGYRNVLDLPGGEHNHIYRNEGASAAGVPRFALVYTSPEVESTRSVAWGDVDQDGDLDLAVGNSASPSRIYRNDGALNSQQVSFALEWATLELADTHSLAWGDMDGDGDLDLALGNTTQSSRVFCNEDGHIATTDCWHSIEAERTRSLAWGDMDGDGDLDLAVGNQEGPNYI